MALLIEMLHFRQMLTSPFSHCFSLTYFKLRVHGRKRQSLLVSVGALSGTVAIGDLGLRSFGQVGLTFVLVAMADSKEGKHSDGKGKSKSDKSDTIKENPEIFGPKLDLTQVSNDNPGRLGTNNKNPCVSDKRPEESNILISDFVASLETNSDDPNTGPVIHLVKEFRDLQEKAKEQKEWAERKVRDSAARLNEDLLELQMLRMAKGEKEKLENKRNPEKSLVLQLTEEYLQNMKCQVSTINDAIRRLEMKNVEIRADTEALKLSGSEFERASQEVLRRGKKCMKKVADVEKQTNILRSQFEDEKLKARHLEQEVLHAEKEAEEMEVFLVSGWEMSDSIGTIKEHLKIDEDMAKEMLLVKNGKMTHNITTDSLQNKFQAVPEDAQDLEPYFKAYILFLLGTVIIPNGSSVIAPMFLPLLESKDINEYAWGAALVAHLKFSMPEKKANLGGFTWALLVFALERFPCLRHGDSDDRPTGDDRPTQFPLFLGWLSYAKRFRNSRNVDSVDKYKDKLELHKKEDVDWQPYRRIQLPKTCTTQLWMIYSYF
ncbi:hypothetical protein OROHE_000978 [Orobanche hederae]